MTVQHIALVYARASNDPEAQRISVDRQIKLCCAKAAELWPSALVKVFRDDAITAADPDVQRPGYAAFLAAVRSARKGELLGVVVNEQSRLTRLGTGAWDELVVTLTKAGLDKVETLRSGPISVQPGNRLVGRLLAVIDAEEVERTKARVQDAHRELFNEGRPSGRPPFGYRRVKGEDGRPAWEPDPTEAPVVKRVFEWTLQGHGINAIVERLNLLGVPPRSARWTFKDGRKVTGWKAVSVRTLLRAPSVAGLRGHTDADGQLHTVPAKWPAIVDVDQWRKVQRMLGGPSTVIGAKGQAYRVRTKPPPQPRRYLLSGGNHQGEMYGVLRCGKCDTPLIAQTQTRRNGGRVPAYGCHPKINPDACGGVSISPADEVEAIVVDAVQHRLAVSSKLRRRLAADEGAEAAGWRAERDTAKARMLETAEMFGSGAIDRDSFNAMHGPAKAAHDLAEAKLAAVTTDTTLPSAEDVQERWEELTFKQQRTVIDRLIGRIVIFPAQSAPHKGFDPERVGKPEWLA